MKPNNKTEKLVLVDKKDRLIGFGKKLKCHLGKGVLHRAFSIYIFNKRNQLLIQKRSKSKLLWPLYWSNTCCSHPRENEDFEEAGERRLEEELGFSCPLRLAGKFQYQASFKKIGSENEICFILLGRYNGKIKPNPKEVADWRWLGMKKLGKEISQNPSNFTPWFKISLKKVFKDGKKLKILS